jgi:hypothetical protein
MVNARCSHPWTVTAPWYDWAQAGVPASGRGTAPIFQKFAADRFINEFIKDPQHSVQFDNDDCVSTANLLTANPGQFAGKVAALFPLTNKLLPWNKKTDPAADLRKVQLLGSAMRKLYLPSHARHYLVVCELHCDVPGFPAPDANTVCQAGFVVRRKQINYPQEARPEALALLRELAEARSKLADLDEIAPLRPNAAKNRAARIARLKAQGKFEGERAKAVALVQSKQQALAAWREKNGVRGFEQGWVPGLHQGIGEWLEVEPEPETLAEAWYPLYRVFADPARPGHDAGGRALFFGSVPTSAFETTQTGDARYDDQNVYEIRCFFRQHNCDCPRQGLNVNAPDCDGPLAWGRPTEPYQLAPQFDLIGTANRPVTIQMPNLGELAAQVQARPIGKFSPVRFVQPQTLRPETDGKSLSGGSMGGGAICFFSIPLITIIAMFVLNLFLPIVVLLFNLWFLLALRFCIPPSIKVDAGLQAELDLIPPKIGVDAEFSVNVDASGFKWPPGTGKDGNTIRNELIPLLAADLAQQTGANSGDVENELKKYSNAPLFALSNAMQEQAKKKAETDGSVKGSLNLAEGLIYRPRRMSQWKHEKYLPTTGEYP